MIRQTVAGGAISLAMSGTGMNKFSLGCAMVLSLVVLPGSLEAQVYSSNIVGYINLVLANGDNLIANQLSQGGNTLGELFPQGAPEGTTFTEWNPSQLAYLPQSIYDTNSGWSIDYTLSYGQGGLLDARSAFTNTFVGSVWPGYDGVHPFVPPQVTDNGVLLLSCFIPINDATFYDVIGRNPEVGDNVTWLNAATRQYQTTVFENSGWNNGDPSLSVGQAAFFGLGGGDSSHLIQAAPEPAMPALLAIGMVYLVSARSRRRYSNQKTGGHNRNEIAHRTTLV
jgi:hypothetical protein